jgi:Protein of unknown function, DUF547
MKKVRFLTVLLPLILLLSSCVEGGREPTIGEIQNSSQPVANGTDIKAFNNENYADVLKKYVDSSGRVNYEKLKSDRQRLDEYNRAIGAVSPETYNAWPEAEKIAFLVNAYNSLTLEAIIDNYPTKSIRDIPGAWTGTRYKIVGKDLTLDEIEHQNLRKYFDEPRVHMALVCAAISCPKLRQEPFTGEKLDAQLDDQTRVFLANPNHFRIDREANKVYVSSILKWFGQDFEKSYSKEPNFPNLNSKETAFLNFISQYLNPSDREFLQKGGYKVEYLHYDWSLNKQP